MTLGVCGWEGGDSWCEVAWRVVTLGVKWLISASRSTTHQSVISLEVLFTNTWHFAACASKAILN